jgi:Protein of unknown function (DUF4038)/Putative collagen-binding domain of a collagenase
MNRTLFFLAVLAALLSSSRVAGFAQQDGGWAAQTLPVKGMKLKVSLNKRYLVNQDGKPFFYLGDTAWTLLKRLNREEVEDYFKNRVAKGFTVIQAYVLRGLEVPNLYGDLTLVDRDPAKPNEAFFKNVDYVVNKANERGLVMSLVVTYGEHVRQVRTKEQVFNTANAFAYGKFLGSRYKSNCVIWLLGGDRPARDDLEVWRAMAKGLKEGSQGTQLVSYHGPGPAPGITDYSSSFWFQNDEWLDFNMIQSGHNWAAPNHEFITHDYNLAPAKPTIDMEARFETHAVLSGGGAGKRIDAHQVREAAYWAMLAGSAGHGYGNNNIYQFYDPESQKPSYKNDRSFPFDRWYGTIQWRKALDFEGAYDMGHVHKLFELRPWYRMVPDQSVIAAGQGDGEDHIQAGRAEDGTFILAYLTFGRRVAIHMDKLSGKRIKAQWYDPREGTWTPIGKYSNTGVREFVPPSSGEQNDWVLVLEDEQKSLPVELAKR